MIQVLIVVAVALAIFIAYILLKPKLGSAPTRAPSASSAPVKKGAPAPTDDEDEVTRVRVAGPRLIRTMGGLRVGDEMPINGFVTIGRGQSVTLKFADAEMSSSHAEVRSENGKVVVIDLGSTNGTFVNGDRIAANTPVTLKDGDQIKLGLTVFLFKNQQ